jgi:hypothetical protein
VVASIALRDLARQTVGGFHVLAHGPKVRPVAGISTYSAVQACIPRKNAQLNALGGALGAPKAPMDAQALSRRLGALREGQSVVLRAHAIAAEALLAHPGRQYRGACN